jgi:hypothetical protein
MACMLGGTVYAASQIEHDDNGNQKDPNSKVTTGIIIGLGCMVVMIAGAGYLGTAEPYRWDAINLFNDAPPPMPMPGAPMPGPGWGAKREDLKMREAALPSEQPVVATPAEPVAPAANSSTE